MILNEIIDLLQKHHFKGAGIYTDFAKGSHELKPKIKWQLLKKLI